MATWSGCSGSKLMVKAGDKGLRSSEAGKLRCVRRRNLMRTQHAIEL